MRAWAALPGFQLLNGARHINRGVGRRIGRHGRYFERDLGLGLGRERQQGQQEREKLSHEGENLVDGKVTLRSTQR